MTIQDLKPGNWLNYRHFTDTFPTLSPIQLDDEMLRSLKNKKYRMMQPEFIEAIDLKEEWLFKFGFEQNLPVSSREYLLNDFIVIDHYENGFLCVNKKGEGGKMLQFVHELQNYYSKKRNEELNLIY